MEERRRKEENDVGELDRRRVRSDEVWYLIHKHWLKSWHAFIAGRAQPPGPITNTSLVDASGSPRPGLRKVHDYRGITPPVWQYFHSVYGGGPPISRRDIAIYGVDPLASPSTETSDEPASMEDGESAADLSVGLETCLSYLELCAFKTTPCPGGAACPHTDDVHMCPFFHTAVDTRRNPTHSPYSSEACFTCEPTPERLWEERTCKFAHGYFEKQFHPSVYKTELCDSFIGRKKCSRGRLCPQAHTAKELRTIQEAAHLGKPPSSIHDDLAHTSSEEDLLMPRQRTFPEDLQISDELDASSGSISGSSFNSFESVEARPQLLARENHILTTQVQRLSENIADLQHKHEQELVEVRLTAKARDREVESLKEQLARRARASDRMKTTEEQLRLSEERLKPIKERLRLADDEIASLRQTLSVHEERCTSLEDDVEKGRWMLRGARDELLHMRGFDLEGLTAEELKALAEDNRDALQRITSAMLKAMECEVSRAKDKAACVVCMDAAIDTICLPCSHFIMCAECAGRVGSNCPSCRAHVVSFQRVFS